MLEYRHTLLSVDNHMAKSKFSVTHKDSSIVALMEKSDHKTLAVWAIDCVERVLPFFEAEYPEDYRPGALVKYDSRKKVVSSI